MYTTFYSSGRKRRSQYTLARMYMHTGLIPSNQVEILLLDERVRSNGGSAAIGALSTSYKVCVSSVSSKLSAEASSSHRFSVINFVNYRESVINFIATCA